MPYRWRPDEERSSCHWGQLKLIEAELKVLTDFCGALRPACGAEARPQQARLSVLYVGAAPGRHVPALARRFPACTFELWDPAEFDPGLLKFASSPEACGRVSVVQSFFDEASAAALGSRQRSDPLVFFCDIRTADEQTMSEVEISECIRRDMERQRSWVETLHPAVSLLKFRLPWGRGRTPYLPGHLLVQAFPPCTSTETRLVVTREALRASEDVVYDHQAYEERLMWHNAVGRACLHDPQVPLAGARAVPGLDRCFDCAALAATARRWLRLARGAGEGVSDDEVAAEISAIISEVSESGRTLADQYHVSSSRHCGRRFAKRRYLDADGQDKFSMEAREKNRCVDPRDVDSPRLQKGQR